MNRREFTTLATWAGMGASLRAAPVPAAEIVVYGATPAGIAAAIEAARMGRRVTLVSPDKHVGGITVEGLGGSDINNHWFRNDVAVGGLALEFYRRVGKRYGVDGPQWRFEPHVAEAVFEEMLAAQPVRVLRGIALREPWSRAVEKQGSRVHAVLLADGTRLEARQFIDASLEGDLMEAAGVSTFIGREANAKYGETKNGIRGENTYRQFAVRVDPYWRPGVRSSGVIPTIQDEPFGTPGEGDHRIQGYCFRMCLTRRPANRVPIEKPSGFHRKQYEIYFRYLAAGGQLFTPDGRLPNGKTDLGSWHDLSANLYGMNHLYPAGSPAVRARILEEHRVFTIGLLWLLQNDPAVPEELRDAWKPWGLPADEFADNGHWPRQFYVREARRMVSDTVITEHHTRRVNAEPVRDPVAVAYWPPDTHHVRRIVRDGAAYNEGFVFGGEDWGPFGIPYRSMTPRIEQATNLLTPTCLSSTHVAYGAIRLEWTFLALGQAAGAAAAMAETQGVAVQAVPYDQLAKHLRDAGAVLAVNLPIPMATALTGN